MSELTIKSEADTYPRQIGRIDDVHLGIEDHGIYTFNLGFDFGGTHQGIGHLCIGSPTRDEWSPAGLKLLYEVEKITGPLLKANGKTVLVLRENDSWGAYIVGIQALIGGKPLIFKDVLASSPAREEGSDA